MTRQLSLLALPLLVALGCSGQSSDDDDRGPLGKADMLSGSCQSYCGEQSDGACWCDDLCEFFKDCCDDYASACAGECAQEGHFCIDGPCCDGLTCDGESSTCMTEICFGPGEPCIDGPCCDGLTCDGESSTCF
jgi:hypothetical protein